MSPSIQLPPSFMIVFGRTTLVKCNITQQGLQYGELRQYSGGN